MNVFTWIYRRIYTKLPAPSHNHKDAIAARLFELLKNVDEWEPGCTKPFITHKPTGIELHCSDEYKYAFISEPVEVRFSGAIERLIWEKSLLIRYRAGSDHACCEASVVLWDTMVALSLVGDDKTEDVQ